MRGRTYSERIVMYLWKTLVILVVASGLGASVCAQDEADTVSSLPGIEIETSVDLAEIYIGDLITYRVTITHDSTYELVPPPLGANLGAFDVKDYQPDITEKLPDGRIRSETVFMLTTFTTGDYVIPPLPVLFNLPDSSHKVLLAEPVPIKVKSLLADAGDSLDIRPSKAQYEFKRPINPYYLWGGLAFLLLVGGIILWLLLRRRKSVAELVDLRPPWEIAFEKLARLKEQNLPVTGNHKRYYFELTEIARGYLGRMYEADVLEMTTEEFLDQFSERALPPGLFDQMASFLTHADLVKFARFVPEQGRPEADFEFIHKMIESVRLEYEQHQQAVVLGNVAVPAAPPVAEREDS